MSEDALVLPLDGAEAPADTVPVGEALGVLGGKGASLVRLAAHGLPVPPGFVVTTRAYRDFVADGLDREIRIALSDVDSAERAAEVIAGAFARRELPAAITAAVRDAYAEIDAPVAVRSSATAEDLPELSFAGQHDTYLNVTGAEAVLGAVRRCWASLWTARAIGYRARNGIPADSVALAVVVQRLVPAEAAGVLFTANPLTGARNELVINASWGLGEAVVGGGVTPDTYVLAHGTHTELSREVHDKESMTVLAPEGPRDAPVPWDKRRKHVLDQEGAAGLAALGERIHGLYGMPMDVEWTVQDGRFWIVQARPITSLTPAGWNDSLAGDYLWTCANLGEAVPSVMTPSTWSLVRALAMPPVGRHVTAGNIGGRFYLNLSVYFGLGRALGLSGAVRRGLEQAFGGIPDGVEVPPLPMSRFALLRAAVAAGVPLFRQALAYRRRLPRLLAETPDRCRSLHARIRDADSAPALRELWRSDVDSLLRETTRALDAGARQPGPAPLQSGLRDLVGDADATTLMTGLHRAGARAGGAAPRRDRPGHLRGHLGTPLRRRVRDLRPPALGGSGMDRPAAGPAR